MYRALNPPITARYIRFKPVASYGRASMRVEDVYEVLKKRQVKMCQTWTKRERHSSFFFDFYKVHLSFRLQDKL